jgi:hypothetical protein
MNKLLFTISNGNRNAEDGGGGGGGGVKENKSEE